MGFQVIILDNDYSDPKILQDVSNSAEQISFETGLHGGMLALNFKAGATMLDAYEWYRQYVGKRILTFDHDHRPLFDGRLEDVKLEPGQIEIMTLGYWSHMSDQFYQDSVSWLATGDAKAIIEDMLTNKCPNISTDFSNIQDTNFDVFPIEFDNYERPRQIVEHLAGLGDDQTPPREWFFAVWPAPMTGPLPNMPLAHFFPRPGDDEIDWYITLGDLAPGQQALALARSFKNLFNRAAAVYSDSVGSRMTTAWADDTDSQALYGLREGILSIGGATAATAAGARDQFLEKSKEPQQSSTLLLDSYVYDAAGRRHNLWEVRAGDVIRIADLVPTDVGFSTDQLDALRTFFIKRTRYTADNHRLAISPDYTSAALDILLSRAGLSGGKSVA